MEIDWTCSLATAAEQYDHSIRFSDTKLITSIYNIMDGFGIKYSEINPQTLYECHKAISEKWVNSTEKEQREMFLNVCRIATDRELKVPMRELRPGRYFVDATNL